MEKEQQNVSTWNKKSVKMQMGASEVIAFNSHPLTENAYDCFNLKKAVAGL